MILVDTPIWVDHLRSGNATLGALLDASRVLVHPFVVGEIALGNLSRREVVLAALNDLPSALVATDPEVLGYIDRHALFGRGVGYVDAHLLASTGLTAGAKLWTSDRRLRAVATLLGLAMTGGGET